MTSSNNTDLSKNPIVVIIGLVGTIAAIVVACIAIFTFITGKKDIPEALSTPVTPSIIANTPTYPSVPPTPTQTPILPTPSIIGEASTWPVIFHDTFEIDTGDWLNGNYNDERLIGSWLVIDDKYRWEGTALQNASWTGYRGMSAVSDFYLKVEAKRISGPKHNGIWYHIPL